MPGVERMKEVGKQVEERGNGISHSFMVCAAVVYHRIIDSHGGLDFDFYPESGERH